MSEYRFNLFELTNKVQAISMATHGADPALTDREEYLKDVKNRIPNIEKALAELKEHIRQIDGD